MVSSGPSTSYLFEKISEYFSTVDGAALYVGFKNYILLTPPPVYFSGGNHTLCDGKTPPNLCPHEEPHPQLFYLDTEFKFYIEWYYFLVHSFYFCPRVTNIFYSRRESEHRGWIFWERKSYAGMWGDLLWIPVLVIIICVIINVIGPGTFTLISTVGVYLNFYSTAQLCRAGFAPIWNWYNCLLLLHPCLLPYVPNQTYLWKWYYTHRNNNNIGDLEDECLLWYGRQLILIPYEEFFISPEVTPGHGRCIGRVPKVETVTVRYTEFEVTVK